MNTTLHRGIAHPPDIEDQTVLHIPRPDELRKLALADRLSLRIGLWLLQRAQRPRREPRTLHFAPDDLLPLGARNRTPGETYALFTYDMQRGMR